MDSRPLSRDLHRLLGRLRDGYNRPLGGGFAPHTHPHAKVHTHAQTRLRGGGRAARRVRVPAELRGLSLEPVDVEPGGPAVELGVGQELRRLSRREVEAERRRRRSDRERGGQGFLELEPWVAHAVDGISQAPNLRARRAGGFYLAQDTDNIVIRQVAEIDHVVGAQFLKHRRVLGRPPGVQIIEPLANRVGRFRTLGGRSGLRTANPLKTPPAPPPSGGSSGRSGRSETQF